MFYGFISHILFSGQIFIMSVSALFFSLIVAHVSLKVLRKHKIGQYIRTLGPSNHQSKAGTPSMGGVIFIIPSFVISILFIPLSSFILWLLIATLLFFFIIGTLDDGLKLFKHHFDGMNVRQKFLLQMLCAFILSLLIFKQQGDTSIAIPFVHISIQLPSAIYILFSFFIIISWVNAFNLTDGLDGLLGGISTECFLALLFISYMGWIHVDQSSVLDTEFTAEYILNLFLPTLIVSLCVFLYYNRHPAKIFMGDTGSLVLGGIFAVCTILLKVEFLSLILGALMIAETLSVIIQVGYYKLTKRRFFRMAPLHHHFELKGYHEKNIVKWAYIIQLIACVLFVYLAICYK